MIIGLTGRIASGKQVIVDYLIKKGFRYYTISNIIREEASKRGIAIERKNLQDLGNEVRNTDGPGAWTKRLIAKMEQGQNYVIDGIRNPGEIIELRKLKNFYLIAIDAPQKQRFERFIKRAKPSDPHTWEDFLVIDKRDFGEDDLNGQQVGLCIKMNDFSINNSGYVEDFLRKFEEVFEKIDKKG